MKNKQLIGRLEEVSLTELDIIDITAKIDTGAYTSSLHCHDIVESDNKLEFYLLDPRHPAYNEQKNIFTNYTKKKVKSSNGLTEYRFQIKTKIQFGKKTFNSQFTLTDRTKMRYPILIGRKTLSSKFLVDPAKKFMLKIRSEDQKEGTKK
jgi:hypothetical protein